MDFSAEGILARMKAALKNEDTKMEGSFSMDNLQAVAWVNSTQPKKLRTAVIARAAMQNQVR